MVIVFGDNNYTIDNCTHALEYCQGDGTLSLDINIKTDKTLKEIYEEIVPHLGETIKIIGEGKDFTYNDYNNIQIISRYIDHSGDVVRIALDNYNGETSNDTTQYDPAVDPNNEDIEIYKENEDIGQDIFA